MADTPKHSVSVAGIVVDDQQRVLVIKRRDNGQWEPPGGVLELHESPQDGVIREVLEETGLTVEIQCLSGVYKNLDKSVISLVFRCRAPTTITAQVTEEAAAIRWMPLVEAAAEMSLAYYVRVSDAFRSEVSVRTHDGIRLLDSSDC